jgi:hypothetical protein
MAVVVLRSVPEQFRDLQFVAVQEPALSLQCQRVLAIPFNCIKLSYQLKINRRISGEPDA